MRILVTCPPMLRMMTAFQDSFARLGFECTTPEVVQTLSITELLDLVPQHDGWIIGDDPATREVFAAGKRGKLKAAVKWGVGIDNVDFDGAHSVGVPVTNTPQMFGAEVADIAVGYVIALARETFLIDRGVRAGGWPKPTGISLAGKRAALVGYGDIGKNTARRLVAHEMKVTVYDPFVDGEGASSDLDFAAWPAGLAEADFVVLTCALTPANRYMLNEAILAQCKSGVRIVNVSRGPLIDEIALVQALRSGRVHSVALDVFDREPLPADSPLRDFERCIFGSHNASNTIDAVTRTSKRAIALMAEMLKRSAEA